MNLPLTISETQSGLKEKSFSAVELVDNYLARIRAFDKRINSFITVTEDIAYQQAKETDRYIADRGDQAFEEKPLLGVVTSYKDIYMTKGVRTTAASNVLKDYIAQYSATAVEKLQNAGAIMIGKTNLDAWAHGSSGENSDFGMTKNPWNEEFVPGGSSSGAGAALAAQFCMISTGTDTCGSIRLPANYCGVVGLKPTYGSVSRYGIIAMASSLDSIGHLTASVSDSKKVFDVTSGPDGKDSTMATASYDYVKRKRVIGIPKEFFIEGLDRETQKAVEEAIAVLKSKGVEFREISLAHTKYGIEVYYIIQPAEVSSNLARFDGVRYGAQRDTFGAEAKRRIMLGTYVLSAGYYDAYYLRAMKVRTLILNEINKAFDLTSDGVDAIIAPVAPTPPFKLGQKVDDPLQMYLTDIFAATANLAGIPSLAIPAGFTKSGLPLGFQLMGPKFSEEMLFEIGQLYQSHTDFHTKRPTLA